MIKSKKKLVYQYFRTSFDVIDKILNDFDKCCNVYWKEKNGNPKGRRIVYVTDSALKRLHKRILYDIFYKIELPSCVMGGRKGFDHVDHAHNHKGRKYIFQTDLSNFFPTVKSIDIKRALRREGFSNPNTNLITELTTYEGVLAQGFATSPCLSNIVFKEVDQEIFDYIRGKKILYTRFIDDFAFSSNIDMEQHINAIIKILSKNGYEISRRKTSYRNKRANITGVNVGNNTIKPKKLFMDADERNLSMEQINGRRAYQKYVMTHKKNSKQE
ncbi:MAG: reverse transcriptase family protein [Aureispira sp.]